MLDNFLLGREDGFVQNRAGALADLKKYSAQFGFDIDPDALVSSLTVGERQQLEIMRLLSLGAKILIFDEPTTGISLPQKIKLFDTLRLLAQAGMTVIFVTHKLQDAEDLCGKVTVLRLGQVVGEVSKPFTADQLVKLMFGQALTTSAREQIDLGEPVLDLRNVAVADYRLRVPDINVQVCAGEVIGLAGIEGSGQRLFLRMCAGLDQPVAGEMWIAGAKMNARPYQQFLERGVAYLPAGRLEEGLGAGSKSHRAFYSGAAREGIFHQLECRARRRARKNQRASHSRRAGLARRITLRRESTTRVARALATESPFDSAGTSHARTGH